MKKNELNEEKVVLKLNPKYCQIILDNMDNIGCLINSYTKMKKKMKFKFQRNEFKEDIQHVAFDRRRYRYMDNDTRMFLLNYNTIFSKFNGPDEVIKFLDEIINSDYRIFIQYVNENWHQMNNMSEILNKIDSMGINSFNLYLKGELLNKYKITHAVIPNANQETYGLKPLHTKYYYADKIEIDDKIDYRLHLNKDVDPFSIEYSSQKPNYVFTLFKGEELGRELDLASLLFDPKLLPNVENGFDALYEEIIHKAKLNNDYNIYRRERKALADEIYEGISSVPRNVLESIDNYNAINYILDTTDYYSEEDTKVIKDYLSKIRDLLIGLGTYVNDIGEFTLEATLDSEGLGHFLPDYIDYKSEETVKESIR